MMPLSKKNIDEGWMKTYQSFHNNSINWWSKKFERKFSRVYVIDSSGMILFLLENGFYVLNNQNVKIHS